MVLNIRKFLIAVGFISFFLYYINSITTLNIPHVLVLGSYILGCISFIICAFWKKNNKIYYFLILFFLITFIKNFFWGLDEPSTNKFDYRFFSTILLIIALKKEDINWIIKLSIRLTSLMILSIVILSFFDVTKDIVISYGNRVRHSLGFSHPNSLAMMVMFVSIQILYRYKKYLSMKILVIIINFIIFQITDSRTEFFCILIFIILSFLIKWIKQRYLSFMVGILFILGILPSVLFNNNSNIWLTLNDIFSSRIIMWNYYFKLYGLTLFGQPIVYNFDYAPNVFYNWNRTYFLDSAYLNIFFRYGLITILLVFILIIKGIKRLYKDKNFVGIAFVITMLVFGLTETHAYNLILIPGFLLVIQDYLNKERFN